MKDPIKLELERSDVLKIMYALAYTWKMKGRDDMADLYDKIDIELKKGGHDDY